MRALLFAIGLIGASILPCLCHAQVVDDPFSDYLQRSDSIALWAGNANDANEAIQSITPWPPYGNDPRIPLSGRQAVGAVEQMYRVPNPFEQQGTGSGAPTANMSIGSGSSSAGTSTPLEPLSSGN